MNILDKVYLELHGLAYNRVFFIPILAIVTPIVAETLKLADTQQPTWAIPLISIGLSVVATSKFINTYFTAERRELILKQKEKKGTNYLLFILLIMLGLFTLVLSLFLTDLFIIELKPLR